MAEPPPKPKIDPADMKCITPLKDIKPGMKGYGRSVFVGTKVDKFEVTVLGVLKKAYFGDDLILVKLSGGPMTTRGANLIEGMSGSPIYINGKIAGAFAFGYPYGKEPIGMVTPIEYMLDAWDPKLPSKPSSFYPMSTMDLEKPIAVDGKSYGKVAIDFGAQNAQSASGDTLLFRPLATPLMVSGMSEHALANLAQALKPLNIRPVAGPGLASDKAKLNVDLQPGSAVGCSFVTGDVDMTGVGTVTYRRGNKILAFGHPMMSNPLMNGLGAVNAPLTTAYIYDVYPSLQVSMKIAAPIRTIGTVFQDRPWAIAGKIGEGPTDMIPVSVRVTDPNRGFSRNFQVKVVNHPMLATSLIASSVGEAIFEMRGNPSDCTAKIGFEVIADEVGSIKRQNTFFDPVSIDTAAVQELGSVLNMLQFNPFYPVGVKKVNVDVNLVPKHMTAKLDKIFLREGKFKPGDMIEVGAVLRPFKGEKITKTIKLQLPKNMPNGRVSVEVMGGSLSRSSIAISDSGLDSGGPIAISPVASSSPNLDNLQQMIKKFLERDKNNDLVVRIILPKSVPSIAGEKFSGLPPSISEAMKSSKVSALGTDRDEIKTVTPTDWVVLGSQRLSVNIQKEDKSEKKSSARKPSDSSPPPSDSAPSDSSSSDESDPNAAFAEGYSVQSVVVNKASDEAPIPPPPPGAEITSPADEKPDSAKPEEPAATEETTGTAPKPAESTSTSGTNEKPVGRTPGSWKQTLRTDFLGGTFKNTTATTGDLLTLAGSLNLLSDTGEAYVWCIKSDGKGSVYLGTGNKGIIYKAGPDGKASVLYDSPELEIQSLALDKAGNVYAGTAPNGIIYKVTPDGKAIKLFDADEKYITALAMDSKGDLYAATGDKCKVYRISPDGKAESVLDSSEFHALALAVDKQDNVYVGTGLNGIIYKITPDGHATVLYDADDDSITALAVDVQGAVYAGTSTKGVIYKIAPGATPKVLYDKADKGILGLATDGDGSVYAVSPTSVYKITSDEKVCTLGNEKDLQFLSVAVGDGRLYAGTGNLGSIYTAEIGKTTSGTYESTVHDCTQPSKWGIIEWTADTPKGASISVQTRSGSVAEPDSSWSPWSAPYVTSASTITSPPGRYIQYLITMKADDPSASPKLRDMNIVYMSKNQAPKLTLSAPKGGEKWAGKQTIRWSGTDPDKDTLDYKVYYSADNGTTWKQIADKIQKPAPAPKKDEKKPSASADKSKDTKANEPTEEEMGDPEQILAEMAAELDKHPEIPQEVRDKILAEAPVGTSAPAPDAAPTDSKDSAAAEEKPSGNGTKSTSLSWDTAKVKDGTYLIKVVGSDGLSNATDAQTGEALSEQIIVCNKKPKVVGFKKTITVQPDKSVKFDGFAQQDLIGIAGIQYRIGTGDWASAAANDGIFDSGFEAFTVTTQPLAKGEYTIELKAIDQAGNSLTTKLKVKVE